MCVVWLSCAAAFGELSNCLAAAPRAPAAAFNKEAARTSARMLERGSKTVQGSDVLGVLARAAVGALRWPLVAVMLALAPFAIGLAWRDGAAMASGNKGGA